MYTHTGYQKSDVVRVNFNLNGSPVDALSAIVHKDHAEALARFVL